MSLNEVQDKLDNLCKNISPEMFIFNLLEIYEFPKTTILKLKKEEDQSVLKIKNKLYFKKTTKEEDEHVAIDDLSKNKDVLKLNPRFIVVTDYDNLVAIDTKKNVDDPSRTLDVKIVDLYKRYDFFAPWLGVESYQVDKEAVADIKAANKMAKLYDQILSDNPNFYTTNSSDLNLLLSRLLFCFFAEDTGIFEKNLFTNSILSNSDTSGNNLSDYIERVFDVFNVDYQNRTEKYSDFSNFPYVNGGLFKDKISIPKFTKKTRDLLEECGNLEWSEINPDIFGSMIQAVVHPNQRENLGMHYTSVPNIMKLIRPLFLDDLYEEYFNSIGNKKKLEELRKRISNIKVFDPACGSGNFLIISYKELCKLEALILKQLLGDANRLDLDITFSSITLNNFYGIEIDDFAHDVAKLSLYLAQHQVNVMFEKEFGKLKPILPLRESGNIKCANSARSNWEEICSNKGEVYVVGNPPFEGSRKQKESQKLDIDFVFKNRTRVYKSLDYVSIWYLKLADYIKFSERARGALVSTNSVSQGEHVGMLWPLIFNLGIEISFAYHSFKWENNAKNNAGVTVVIIGLSKTGNTQHKKIFIEDKSVTVDNINGYLLNFKNVFIHPRSEPISNFPKINFGNMPAEGGKLLFNKEEMELFIKNDPSVRKFFKRLVSADDFINGQLRYCLWFLDHDIEELNNIDSIKKVLQQVKSIRLQSSRPKLAETPHLFAQITQNMSCDNIVIPRVSSEKRNIIPIGIIKKGNIITDSLYVLPLQELYLFGVLNSRMHMIWVRYIGGKLETRLSYSKDIVYNNFPFPKITQKQKEIIINQVYNILDEREKYPGKTLAELYDPEKMPHTLKQAHEFLDEVIDRIYRVKPFENDEERLAHLFKLYEEMVEEEKQKSKN